VSPARRLVIALGGNALSETESRRSSVGQQADAARHAFEGIASVIAAADQVLVSHGNGPQVGSLLLRSEVSVDVRHLPPLPLDTCVADTAGGLGYTLARELRNVLHRSGAEREVAAVITEVLVEAPGAPTKPIGESYPFELRGELEERGWRLVETAEGRLRRVVPSPAPCEVLELDSIRRLFEAGTVVIAGGGGGVPVARGSDGALRGVEGVIDKDLLSALLGELLEADLMMILTDVDQVLVDYGKDSARPLGTVSVGELRRHHADGQFPPGSMGPKVEAALRFVERTGGRAVITSLERAGAALRDGAGTWIVPALA
jgi:carbamate kinase